MTAAFVVRLEFSLVRSRGTNYEESYVVRGETTGMDRRASYLLVL